MFLVAPTLVLLHIYCKGKSISPQTRDNDRQKTFYKYFNVNFHQNLQQYMLINNSSHLYIPNNTLHNN